MIRRTAALCLLFVFLTSARGAAAPDFASFATSLEPIALAHAASALGDAAMLHALDQSAAREALVVAVRAAAQATAPERFIPALVRVACGRDPVAAPDAALTLSALTEVLTADRLAVREANLADLAAARGALESGCEYAPRADVSLALSLLAQHLEALEAGP